jgi:predicted flavoprotein YhiN
VQVQKIEIAVIGAGAAGYFAAIAAASKGAKVHIFEKTTKTLTKVKVSGGGRCNVTHDCESPAQLVLSSGRSPLKESIFRIRA